MKSVTFEIVLNLLKFGFSQDAINLTLLIIVLDLILQGLTSNLITRTFLSGLLRNLVGLIKYDSEVLVYFLQGVSGR